MQTSGLKRIISVALLSKKKKKSPLLSYGTEISIFPTFFPSFQAVAIQTAP
jgi:hypothetical protein